jgi:hypothetical protein
VLRHRFDVEYDFDFNFEESNENIIIPYTHNNYGICDNFAFGTSEEIDKFSKVYNNIVFYMTHSIDGRNPVGMSPESLLRYHLLYSNIKFKQKIYDWKLRKNKMI